MNDPGIFVAGVVVFLIVATALGLLVWGLRMEARQNRLRDYGPMSGAPRKLPDTPRPRHGTR